MLNHEKAHHQTGWELRIKTDSKMDKTSIQIDTAFIENHSCG